MYLAVQCNCLHNIIVKAPLKLQLIHRKTTFLVRKRFHLSEEIGFIGFICRKKRVLFVGRNRFYLSEEKDFICRKKQVSFVGRNRFHLSEEKGFICWKE